MSQSGKQPSDQKHYLQGATELTVHFSMSQAQEEFSTIKTFEENNEEYAYAVVDENKRKSKCDQGDRSNSEGGEVPPSSKDEHIAADQSAFKESTKRCDRKGHHVYANLLVKENKAMFCKTTVSRDGSLDVTCTEHSLTMGEDPVEDLNCLSLEQGQEMNSNEARSKQDRNDGTECNDHFYAVVHKSKKKRMAPKVSIFKPLVPIDRLADIFE